MEAQIFRYLVEVREPDADAIDTTAAEIMETGVNVPRWSLPVGPNRVFGAWDPHLVLPAGLAAVELGVVDGPVLADVDYITDYSGPSGKAVGSGSRRYRGLDDVLAPTELATWRARMVALLESLLAEGESWFLFVGGKLDPEGDAPDEHFTGHVLTEDLELNGGFTIFEAPAGSLDGYARLFGAYDRVAGLVAPAGSLRGILALLTLGDPMPTGQRYRFSSPFHPRDTSALARVLTRGRLFVEETDNGTRLRCIGEAAALAELRARLAALVAAPG